MNFATFAKNFVSFAVKLFSNRKGHKENAKSAKKKPLFFEINFTFDCISKCGVIK